MIDLTEIEARLKAATPGPWRTEADHRGWHIFIDGKKLRPIGLGPDLALVVNAPTDIAALVAELRLLQGVVAERDAEILRARTAEAKVVRLRVALRDIAHGAYEDWRMREIARKALSGEEGT